MSPSGDSYRVILLGAVLCVPLTLAEQNSPEVKIEKKPVHLPAGDGQKPFDVTRHLIPLTDVQSGGPAKDGIPALNHPAFTSAAEGDRVLNSSDTVLGVDFDGVAKAYPIRILNWHAVVNDDVGHQPVVVSWCPLCGSGLVYSPEAQGRRYTFGVSGLLYKRNLLLTTAKLKAFGHSSEAQPRRATWREGPWSFCQLRRRLGRAGRAHTRRPWFCLSIQDFDATMPETRTVTGNWIDAWRWLFRRNRL